jgi:hypothetical protein
LSQPKKSHLVRNALFGAFVVIFCVGAVVSTPPIFFFNVNVSGHATALAGTPVRVTFEDENGFLYPAPVSSGSYSITLQNGHYYQVFVVYAAGGNCTWGTLNLNTLGWSQTLDASC